MPEKGEFIPLLKELGEEEYSLLVEEYEQAVDDINNALEGGDLGTRLDNTSTEGILYDRAYQIRPAEGIVWATPRFDKFPCFNLELLTSNESPDQGRQSLLSKSEYWTAFSHKAELACAEYPSWSEGQCKIRKTGNLQEWLVKTIKLKEREAEIVKKVLTEIYQKPGLSTT